MPITKPRLSTNINTDVGTFTDPILVLHQGSTAADVDVGFLMNRSNGLTSNAAVIWQESSKSFVHILTNSSGAADANLVVQSYANVSVGNVLLIANAGIYVDGSLGTPGQVLASDGSKTFWAPPGGFTGGTVPNPSVFQSNLVISNTTPSTSNVTGALVVGGGAGFAGNVYADKIYTSNGLYWAGNGNVIVTGGGGGGGGVFTASNTAPVGPNASDFWYYIAGDILFQYINDGDSNQWVDIISPVAPSSTVVSSLVLANVSISSVFNINSTKTALGIPPTVSSTAPVNPIRGDLWYDTDEDITYQYVFDGVGNAWVDISSAEFGFTNNSTALVDTALHGNITPSANGIYSLGNSTFRLRDAWIGGNVNLNRIQSNLIPVANVTNFLGNTNNAFGNIYANALHTFSGVYWAGNGNVFASGGGGTGSLAAAVGYSLVFGG